MKIVRKIFYWLRLFLEILYLILLIRMLPYIYESSWEGLFFLIINFLFIIFTLWSLLSKQKIYKETLSYNLILIFSFLYFALFSFRILLGEKQIFSTLYHINLEYCENNLFIMGLVLIGVIGNTLLLAAGNTNEKDFIKKKEKKLRKIVS